MTCRFIFPDEIIENTENSTTENNKQSTANFSVKQKQEMQ